MYSQYSFLSGVQVCSHPQCTVSSFPSGVQACLHPQCTPSTVSSLVYRYAHIHNVQSVVFSLVYRYAHIHMYTVVFSLVYRYAHIHNVQSVVSSLVYRYAHTHNVQPVQFPLWCTGMLAPIMYSQYSFLWCTGMLAPTMYSQYSFLSGVQVCSHPQCNCKASKVSPLKYGCAYTHSHTHNIWLGMVQLWGLSTFWFIDKIKAGQFW